MTIRPLNAAYEEHVNQKSVHFLRSHVKLSWRRCKELGLTPEHIPKPEVLDRQSLKELRDQYSKLLHIVSSYTREIIFFMPTHSISIEVYTNNSILIDRIGTIPCMTDAYHPLGSKITKKECGNPAVGSCLWHKSPAIVSEDEHFLNVFKGGTCICVPIYNIHNNIIAAINIVLRKGYFSANICGLISAITEKIQNKLILRGEKSKLQMTNKILKAQNDGVANMASIVTHEMRNSLATMSACLQLLLLQKKIDKKTGDRFIFELGKISNLAGSLNTLSEPFKLKLYRCKLSSLLESIVDSLRPRGMLLDISIELHTENRSISVMLDEALIERVFTNIIINAIQAMEVSGGKINISCSLEDNDNEIHIKFKDTGPGIISEDIDKVFELFYTTKSDGTGMGLALCQAIVKSHGGQIKLESEEGVGSEFTVILPCISEQATE